MSGPSFIVFALLLAEAATAIVIAVLLLAFYRDYHKTFLQHWALSWVSYALFEICGFISYVLMTEVGAHHPARIVVGAIGGAFGYLQLVWLIFGAYELARRRPVRMRTINWMLSSAIAIGVLLSLLFLTDPPMSAGRFFVRLGIRALAAAIAFAAAGGLIWRRRGRQRRLSFALITIGFFLYALEELQYFVVTVVTLLHRTRIGYSDYLGFIDLVLLAMIGLGMVTSLLEDEREAAQTATNEIEHLAYHDALTGLPNRPLFVDRLITAIAHASRSKHRLAVLFLDVDRFKDINDSLGHSVGDSLLKSIAERIRHCTREEDTLARFGGDEFTLLVPKLEQVDDAARISQKILETIRIPFQVGERELFLTASIGVSIFPNDGSDAENMIKNSDTAMYRAKEQGRDNYQLYAPAMNAKALERLALEQMLRRAISQQELVLFYQPLVDLQHRRVYGSEALLRWRHPDLGLLSPGHFIASAETSGLIVPIGVWVLRTACRQAKQWQKKLIPNLSVSVNLSARQFQEPDLVQIVSETLRDSGLAPQCLELEITGSNAMQNAENSIHTLRQFKDLGVRISMDDFGTGYSSLSYLKRFPIDTVKLDQSFVHDLPADEDDSAIASAVIAMAHSLRLLVVAEGVETPEQLRFLRERSCDRIQGYLFSPPLPPDDFETLVSKKRDIALG